MWQAVRQAIEGVHFTCPFNTAPSVPACPWGQQPAKRSEKHPESSASKLAGHRPERGYPACWGEGSTMDHPGKLKVEP